MLLSFKIQAQLHIKGKNGPSEVVMVVDGVKDLHHAHSLYAPMFIRLSFTWCERSDLQTSNISWLLNNLYHYPVRVSWLPLSSLAH